MPRSIRCTLSSIEKDGLRVYNVEPEEKELCADYWQKPVSIPDTYCVPLARLSHLLSGSRARSVNTLKSASVTAMP